MMHEQDACDLVLPLGDLDTVAGAMHNDICAWIRQFLFGDVSCANKMQVYWLFLMLQGQKGRTAKTHIGVSR